MNRAAALPQTGSTTARFRPTGSHLTRLLAPRSIAVVGATDRPGAYGSEALLNLQRIGFKGATFAVNPRRSEVHGVRSFPSLPDLPHAPDAVIVAVPRHTVAEAIAEAEAIGAGGAVVFAAGFEEAGNAKLHTDLPVCGPNGNGIVSFHDRVALWGDALAPKPPGDVALIAQSGNVAVNAMAGRHRWHTVLSCGNASPAPFADAVLSRPGVKALALYLEADGDAEEWLPVFEHDVPVVVLKAGASPRGAAAAQAHTGAIAGDQRAVRAFFEACGADWAEDPHDLVELSQALARHRRGGARVGVMTCSGGDSAIAADLAATLGLPLPAPANEAELRALLPPEATVANPLDYTSLLWDDHDRLDRLTDVFAESYDHVLAFFDQADPDWTHSFDAQKHVVASTLPEHAPPGAVAGLRSAMRVAKALTRGPGHRELDTTRFTGPVRWLAEHEAKALLAPDVPPGEVVTAPDQVTVTGPVAVKASGPDLRHKAALGALRIAPDDIAAAVAELLAFTGEVLVERLVPPGPEWFVAVRFDTMVPVLVIGPGGAHAERLDAVTVRTLPVAVEDLPCDPATARLAIRTVEVARAHRLSLLELNPVVRGVALDAVAAQVQEEETA